VQLSRFRAMMFLGLLGWAVAALGQADAQVQSKPNAASLNQRVLNFARSKMGQQVGNGECWTLAYQALDAAGAKRPGQDGLQLYQFGKVVNLRAVVPGDVLQFENVNFKHTNPNGSWSSSSYPHHTAIVSAVSGARITLLNQNVGGNRTVQVSTIDLNDRLPGGTLTAYQAVPR
jgi:hypothetical protein